MTSLQEVESLWEKVCFDPEFQPEGRYKAYRGLVFEGMLEVLQNICPVARGILSEEEWGVVFWDFLKKSPPNSVVIRQLPYEASQYLRTHDHPLSEKYPWLGELMEYEYLEIGVRFSPEDREEVPPGLLKLNPAHALGEYTWPVHFISEDNFSPDKLPRGEFFLFLWREPETLEVEFMEVNPLVAGLLRQWVEGPRELDSLLKEVAEEGGLDATEEYLREGRRMVEGFIKQGIVLTR